MKASPAFLVIAALLSLLHPSFGQQPPPPTTARTKLHLVENDVTINLPFRATIYVVNGAKLGTYLSKEFERLIDETVSEHDQSTPAPVRHARSVDAHEGHPSGVRRPYLLQADISAYPLN